MVEGDILLAVEVGDRPGQFQDAVICPHAEAQRFDRLMEHIG